MVVVVAGPVRDRVTVELEPFEDAVIVTVPAVETVPAFAVNVAEVAAAGTLTAAGTVSPAGLLDKATDTPPVGAAFERVRVQVALALEVSEVGEQLIAETRTEVTRLTDAFATELPRVAVIVAI
jgi:hypothetical protein